jgi:hypothetical protein
MPAVHVATLNPRAAIPRAQRGSCFRPRATGARVPLLEAMEDIARCCVA